MMGMSTFSSAGEKQTPSSQRPVQSDSKSAPLAPLNRKTSYQAPGAASSDERPGQGGSDQTTQFKTPER